MSEQGPPFVFETATAEQLRDRLKLVYVAVQSSEEERLELKLRNNELERRLAGRSIPWTKALALMRSGTVCMREKPWANGGAGSCLHLVRAWSPTGVLMSAWAQAGAESVQWSESCEDSCDPLDVDDLDGLWRVAGKLTPRPTDPDRFMWLSEIPRATWENLD